MKKRNRIVISNWAAIITPALVVASYIWTVSFKFASFEHGLQRLEEKVDELIIKVEALRVNDTDKELRLERLEYRMEAVERKVKP